MRIESKIGDRRDANQLDDAETAGAQANDNKNDQASLLQQLTTESQNEASQGFDTKSALEIARIINHEDAKIAAAVKKAIPEIAQVIDQVARCLRDGGRLIYIGAGSSGRIAALDSSECPPTYSTAPGQVQYIMAGGPKALASAVEVNEDSEELGQRDIARRRPTRKDIVVGVSASGRTPYVVAAVAYARARGAHTAAVTCNRGRPALRCRRHLHRCRRRPRSHLRFHPHEGRHRPEDDSEHDHHRRHDPPGLCVREPDGQRAHAELQAGRARHPHPDERLQDRPADRRNTIKSAGRSVPVALVMLKAKSRQARSRPPAGQVRRQCSPRH